MQLMTQHNDMCRRCHCAESKHVLDDLCKQNVPICQRAYCWGTITDVLIGIQRQPSIISSVFQTEKFCGAVSSPTESSPTPVSVAAATEPTQEKHENMKNLLTASTDHGVLRRSRAVRSKCDFLPSCQLVLWFN